MTYFNNVKTLDELKAEYRRLVKKYHPDCGGDTETMKQINHEHDIIFETLKKQHNAKADENRQTTETAEEFRTIITELLKLDGLDIELCGSWLWIGGNTKEHKDRLKALRCRWSNNKKLWYWRHEENAQRWHKGTSTMSDIRTKYGSQTFKGSQEHSERIGATA